MTGRAVRVLDEHVINRIAAGEVVERPASVIKELVENALDAGATAIRVDIESGGHRLIRVTDDGSGMDRHDALLCIERHATSKIATDADLDGIATLGFRGEALPSIAAVSRFEIQTRTHDADEGTRLVLEGGRLVAVEACGCAPGTRITVQDLFFNVPVRRRFLRTTETEYGHALEAVHREALIRPDVDFHATHDGRETLRAPRVADLRSRAATLLGAVGHALRPVAFERGICKVQGLVSPIGTHRQSATGSLYTYVGHRFVRDPVLRRAVTEAYKGLVPHDRFPVVVLNLDLAPGEVDVNVHPMKVEVRFRHAQDVERALADGIRASLKDYGLSTPIPERRPLPQPPPPTPSPRQGVLPLRAPPGPLLRPTLSRDPPPDAILADDAPPPPLADDVPRPPLAPTAPAPAPTQATAPSPAPHGDRLVEWFTDLRVIGQFADSFLVCESDGEMFLVDQHAAHERITLDRLERQRRARRVESQHLLVPVPVDLSTPQVALLEPHLPLLTSLGLEVTVREGCVSVTAVPATLGRADPRVLLLDLADELAEERPSTRLDDLESRILATLACHTSVRANQRLSTFEMRALLEDLDRVDFAVCAHGRPVAIRIPVAEIAARFHRS